LFCPALNFLNACFSKPYDSISVKVNAAETRVVLNLATRNVAMLRVHSPFCLLPNLHRKHAFFPHNSSPSAKN
jgi:hypothetical protein